MDDDSDPRRYHDLTFDGDLLTATRDDGERLRFSRLERALLATLAARPGRLFSREQLLSAMRAEPEEVSDRNIDFLINRLRRKLGDPARAPRFIATQYGEGYIWIAPPERGERRGFLVIGPLRGLRSSAQAKLVELAAQRLRREVADRCAAGQEVVLSPDWSRDAGAAPQFRFSVSVDVIVRSGGLQAAFTLRDELDGRVVRVVRCGLADSTLFEPLPGVAGRLTGAIWRDLALPPAQALDPAGAPLEIRMQDAAMALSKSVTAGWAYIAERLSEERRRSPDDPELAIMWATYLYARALIGIGFDAAPESYRATWREVERLVIAALPSIRARPILRLGAAKLLFHVDARHLPLVETLVEESLSGSPAFAAALAQLGTVQAFRGELDAALTTYEQALAFCQPGAEFQIYLLVKQSNVRIAQGDWNGAQAIFRRIVAIKPAARGMALRYLSPEDGRPLDAQTQQALATISAGAARRLVTQHLFMIARYFRTPAHARNVMAGLLHHLLPRFGAAILPSEAPEGLGELLAEWRSAHCAGLAPRAHRPR